MHNKSGYIQSRPSERRSGRDLAGHLTLKQRVQAPRSNLAGSVSLVTDKGDEGNNPQIQVSSHDSVAVIPEQTTVVDSHTALPEKELQLLFGHVQANPEDVDAVVELKEDQSSGRSSESEDDDEALARELEAIRRERQKAEVKSERETALEGLAESLRDGRVGLSRSWTEEAVFNVRAAEPTSTQYVNDTVRSEFHKRFLQRYIH